MVIYSSRLQGILKNFSWSVLLLAVVLAVSTISSAYTLLPSVGHSEPCSQVSAEYGFLYIGIANPLKIKVPGVDLDSLIVQVDEYSTVRKKDGRFMVNVTRVGPNSITISAIINGNKVLLGVHELFVKRIPDPVVRLGTFTSGKIPIAAFKVQQGIIASIFDFPVELNFRVQGFEFTHITNQGAPITYKAISGAFTTEIRSVMSNVKVGEIIVMGEIKVKGPDNQTRKLPSVSYIII